VTRSSFDNFEQIFYRLLEEKTHSVLTKRTWETENQKKRTQIEKELAEREAEIVDGASLYFGGVEDYFTYLEVFYIKRTNLRKIFHYYFDENKEPTSANLREQFENLDVLQLEKPSVFYPDEYDGAQTKEFLTGMANVFNAAMEQLRIFQHSAETINEDDATQPQNVFRRDGDVWRIVYKGMEFPHVKDRKGMSFISHLLFHRGAVFQTAIQLEGAIDGLQAGSSVLDHITGEQLEEEGFSTQGLVDREGADNTALLSYKKRLDEINGELAEAEKNNDLSPIDRLKGEKEVLLKEIRNSTIRAQKGPQEHSEEKARKRVSSAILRALDSIEEHELDGFGLSSHLRKHLKPVSFPYSYSPDQPIDWII